MGLQTRILVDDNRVYRPNDVIQGMVQVTNAGKKPLDFALSVELLGQELVEFKKVLCRPCFCCFIYGCVYRCTETEQYKDGCNFIAQSIPLLEHGIIPLGEHSFPFQFQLPSDCPSSYVTKLKKGGHVGYQLKASSNLTLKGEKTKQVTVAGELDLSEWEVSEGCIVQRTDKKGSIGIKMELPRQGFLVGETIPYKINIHVDQGYKSFLKPAVITLFKEEYLFARSFGKSSKTIKTIISQKTMRFQKGESEFLDDIKIPPTTEPTNLAGAEYFKISYYILVSGLKWDDLLVPIIIGTTYGALVLNETREQTEQRGVRFQETPIQIPVDDISEVDAEDNLQKNVHVVSDFNEKGTDNFGFIPDDSIEPSPDYD